MGRLFHSREAYNRTWNQRDAYVPPEAKTDFTIVEEGDKKKYNCNECKAVLHTKEGIKRHIITVHLNLKTYECPLCNKQFKHIGTKSRHLVSKHGMEEVKVSGEKVLQEAKKCICEICNKEVISKSRLTKHMLSHKLYKCPDCPKTFSKVKLWLHRSDEHGLQLPTCGVCGYKNKKERQIIIHQRKVHLKERNIGCPHCDAMFFGVPQLRRHLVRHNPVRIYECPFCMKRFPRLDTLREHKKIHTGDKRKVCHICNERFVQKASLNYHMLKHHPEAC